MDGAENSSPLSALKVFLGEWKITLGDQDISPSATSGQVTFEWLPQEQFLIQRWTIPIPEAPDGLAVIGPDPAKAGHYLQHYFDTRGVARVYQMSLDHGRWTLTREKPDFSPLDFSQRYVGTFSDDDTKITGAWEICHDGTTWEKDFDFTYRKLI